MELWDAYNAAGYPLGRDLVRGEAIPAGCHHVVAEVTVRHTDGSFLLMRRDERKPAYPGRWELTAGGSVLKGETWLDGARRELREETGLCIPDLKSLFEHVTSDSIYIGYLAVYDGPKDAVTLQAGETVDYRWLPPRETLAFVRSPAGIPAQCARLLVYLHQVETEIAKK